MEIQGPTPQLPPSTLAVNTARLPVQSLTLGQSLLAQVVSVNADGSVTLNIENALLQARADFLVKAGQTLQLKVVETGLQTLLKAQLQPSESEVLTQALRQALPRQMPLKPLLANLRAIVQQAESTPQQTAERPASPPTSTAPPTTAGTTTTASTGTTTNANTGAPTTVSANATTAPEPSTPTNGTTPPGSTAVTKEAVTNPKTAQVDTSPGSATRRDITITVQGGRLPARPGQTVIARVASANTGGALLKIGDTVVKAQSSEPLPPGQRLELEVVKNGPQTVLKTSLPAPQSPHPPETPPKAAVMEALFANLGNARQPDRSQPLPLQLVLLARELFRALPTVRQVTTPEGLKQAVLDSGVFLENRFAKAVTNDQGTMKIKDFKAGLLRLMGGLAGQSGEGQVKDLVAQTDGALARIHTHQLTALTAAEEGKQIWLLELPVRRDDDTDVVRMRLEREPRRPGQDTAPCSITLNFDIGGLGPMQARVSLFEQQVSVALWAEKASTVALVNEHLSGLEERLQHAGLSPTGLTCQHGLPKAGENDLRISAGLLDIQA